MVEHKHLNGIHISEVSRLWYRIVSIKVASHQIRWIKVCQVAREERHHTINN